MLDAIARPPRENTYTGAPWSVPLRGEFDINAGTLGAGWEYGGFVGPFPSYNTPIGEIQREAVPV